jgi:thymidylate kinase
MLITVSGIDGSGKTTLCGEIAENLKNRGFDASACMPDYISNNLMKQFCKNYYGDPYAYVPNFSEIYIHGLFVDWLDTYDKILKNRSERILIFDRYLFDFLAQAFHYKVKIGSIIGMLPIFPYPDISFFIDITPDEAFERLRKRTHPKMHHLETLDNLMILDEAYGQVKKTVQWDPTILTRLVTVDNIADEIISRKHVINERKINIR